MITKTASKLQRLWMIQDFQTQIAGPFYSSETPLQRGRRLITTQLAPAITAENVTVQSIGISALEARDDQAVAAVSQVEQDRSQRLADIATRLQSTQILSRAELASLQALGTRSFDEAHKALLRQQELEAARRYDQDLQSTVDDLAEPFKFTGKRLRDLAGGMATLHDLRDLMAGKQPAQEEAVIKQLALLIALAENNKQPQQFFDRLHANYRSIQEWLDGNPTAKITKPVLARTLDWLEEFSDADGSDARLRGTQLGTFMQAYNFVPDVTPADPAPVEAAPKGQVSDRRQAALAAYGERLSKLLESHAIMHADVDAVKPSRAPAADERRKTRRNTGLSADVLMMDFERVEQTIELADRFAAHGKFVELYFTNPTSWNPIPPFVLYISDAKSSSYGVCLIEPPIKKRASRVVAVDGLLVQDWREIIEAPTDELDNDFGAQTFVHSPQGSPTFSRHYTARLEPFMIMKLASLRNG